MTIHDIDWNLLWQEARQASPRKKKTAADWDKKAAGFARRTRSSVYVDFFLDLLQPQPEWSILDVGCGPGTIAVPLSGRVQRITALDYSPRMLELLKERATRERAGNITVHPLAWEDDWQAAGVKKHDVAIASRSLAVNDLQASLKKLTSFARLKVCVTDRVGHGPVDPDAYAAVGRPLPIGADYIYTVNMLYAMGIHAEVRLIPLEQTMTYPSMEEAVASYSWMFQELSGKEEQRLTAYVSSLAAGEKDGQLLIRRRHVPRWAFISWHIPREE